MQKSTACDIIRMGRENAVLYVDNQGNKNQGNKYWIFNFNADVSDVLVDFN